MNIALWLHRNALAHGNRPALALGTELVHDYASFGLAASACAVALREQGLQAGDRVGLYMDNTPDYLLALWGLWWMGAVAVPLNARLHGREAGWILGQCTAKACFVDERHADELSPFAPSCLALWSQLPTSPAARSHPPGDAGQ